jgi:hypothetical protein
MSSGTFFEDAAYLLVIGALMIGAGLFVLRIYGQSFRQNPRSTMSLDLAWSQLTGPGGVPVVVAVLLVAGGAIACAVPFAFALFWLVSELASG